MWIDANGNGVFDAGEAPVAGVTVTLYDATGTAVGTRTTDASGNYLFTGLRPGTYTVGFSTLPADYVFTTKDAGGDDAKDSDADRTTGRTGPVVLASGDDNRTVDAGIYLPATLGDRVFDDANGDGIQEPGEGGVGGVTVTLYAADGTTVLATQTTDGNGNYLFTGLTPGTYVVGFSGIPTGKILTNANVGDDRYDSDADRTTGKTGPYTLASGDNNRDVDAGISPPGADLSLTKSVLPVVYAKGQTLTYSVTVRNAGPLDATNVFVTDILPRGLDGPTGSATNGSISMRAWPDTSRWIIPFIAAGDSATWTVSATLITRDAITNVAEIVAADQFDFDSTPGNHDPTEDDQASVTVTAGQSSVADLSVEKTANRTHVTAGDQIIFNIYLRNIGPAAGTNVTVLDALPAGLTFVSATTSTGTYDPATGLWTLPTIARNTRERLTIVATFTGTAPVRNTAQVQTSDQHDPDSTPGNGNPAEDDQSSVIVGPGGGGGATLIDVSLTKTASAQTVAIGQTVTYTVVARNAGPATATGVVVRDLLPAGVDFVSATQTVGSYTPSTGLWPVGTLTAGQSQTLTITARVTASGVIVNTAEVTAHDQIDRDSTPGNGNPNEDDQASAPITGGSAASADLSVNKTVSTPTPRVGDVVTYTVNVSNAGPAGATGVVVRDVMPAGLAFVQFNGTPCGDGERPDDHLDHRQPRPRADGQPQLPGARDRRRVVRERRRGHPQRPARPGLDAQQRQPRRGRPVRRPDHHRRHVGRWKRGRRIGRLDGDDPRAPPDAAPRRRAGPRLAPRRSRRGLRRQHDRPEPLARRHRVGGAERRSLGPSSDRADRRPAADRRDGDDARRPRRRHERPRSRGDGLHPPRRTAPRRPLRRHEPERRPLRPHEEHLRPAGRWPPRLRADARRERPAVRDVEAGAGDR